MNSLEQYVRDRKALFEEEPASGHFERLQQKMNHKSRRINLWSISIAASVAVLLAVGTIWLYYIQPERGCEYAGDMKICYLDKMYVLAHCIEERIVDFDVWDQQQVMGDVQSIFEAVNSDFEIEIPDELPDNKVRAILSDYYRQNLESLEMIAKIIIN